MECVPPVSAEVVKVAFPALSATVASVVAPSLKVTVPAGGRDAAVTVGVNATLSPKIEGLLFDVSAVVDGRGAAGVQVPFSTQPLFRPLLPAAYRYTFFCPVNVPLKVSATLNVRLLPDLLKEEPVPLSVHWLFDTCAEEPGVTAADKPVPASL